MKIFKLKDISEFIRNGVTIKQDISSKEGIPITRIETISKGTIDFNKLGYANIFKIEKYKEWLLKKGDILISHINSEKHLGKSAIYLDNNYDIIHGMNLLCIRVIDKKVFPEYLQLFFKTNQYKKQIKKITKKSVNQASFSVNDFKEILITLPELNIQEKIIKKIKVLEKILENNKLKLDYLSELAKSLFTRMFGDILSNSFNWEQVKLQDICSSIVRGPFGSSLKKEFFVKNGYKVYEQKNAINQSADLGEYYIDEKKFKELQRFECKTGDIIMSCSGTVGKLFQLPKNSKTGIINQALCKFSLNNKIISIYFLKYLEKVMENLKLNGSGIKNISSVSYIKKIDINLPPIELQNKFAERVEKIEKLSFIISSVIFKISETL